MQLREMTSQEVNSLDRATIVLTPFGAMEQHGAHLPLETDALIAERLALRLDESCDGRLLVLPTQWLGLSTHHMSFAGTISASVDTYLALAAEIIGVYRSRRLSKGGGVERPRRKLFRTRCRAHQNCACRIQTPALCW